MDIFYPKRKLNTSEILLVGFDQRPDYLLSGTNWDAVDYNVKEINNSFQAYNWLNGKEHSLAMTKDNFQVAIICRYEFLVKDDFLLLRNLQQNPLLRLVPFIVVADQDTNIDRIKSLQSGIDDCYKLPVEWNNLRRRIEFLRKYKAEILSYSNKSIKDEYSTPLGKRSFDILSSLSLIILFSPILLLIALLVKLESKGPIVYRSKRVGTGYQVFDFLKFRSMVQDADSKLNDLSHLNAYADKGKGKVSFVKLKDDPRITRVGKFIRKTSLDELPQLFNVLRGEMSVVGNRPLPLYEAEQITKDDWARRFKAPAGITGLWQVSGKNKDTMSSEERIALDINYAEDCSFLLDMKILFRTLPAMIQKEE